LYKQKSKGFFLPFLLLRFIGIFDVSNRAFCL